MQSKKKQKQAADQKVGHASEHEVEDLEVLETFSLRDNADIGNNSSQKVSATLTCLFCFTSADIESLRCCDYDFRRLFSLSNARDNADIGNNSSQKVSATLTCLYCFSSADIESLKCCDYDLAIHLPKLILDRITSH